MTVWKQRFFRWNFFFVNGIYYDMYYILFNWRLGFWELGAKIFVFQEVYETVLYLLAPLVLPISFVVRPTFCAYLFVGTFVMYFVNAIIFNFVSIPLSQMDLLRANHKLFQVHLRSRKENVSLIALLYYMPYKVVLTFVNILSCYHSIIEYAKYFSKRHPKVIEDDKAVEIILRLEEEKVPPTTIMPTTSDPRSSYSSVQPARRFTITAVGTRLAAIHQDTPLEIDEKDFADIPLTSVLPTQQPIHRTSGATAAGALVGVQDFALARTQSPSSIVSEHFHTTRPRSPISVTSEHSIPAPYTQDLEPILEDDTSLPGLISWAPLRPAPSTRSSRASSHATNWASALHQDLSVLHGSTALRSPDSTSPYPHGSPISQPQPAPGRRSSLRRPRLRSPIQSSDSAISPTTTAAPAHRLPSIRRSFSPTIPASSRNPINSVTPPTAVTTTTTIANPNIVSGTIDPHSTLPLAQAIESGLITLSENLLALTQRSPPTRTTASTPPPASANPRPRKRTRRSWGRTKTLIILPDSESEGEGGKVVGGAETRSEGGRRESESRADEALIGGRVRHSA